MSGNNENPKILIQHNGVDISDTELPNYMNNYFASIGVNLSSMINVDNSTYIVSLSDNTNTSEMLEWDRISTFEVINLADSIDLNKNSYIPQINTFLFKECLLCSIDQVTYLFNQCCIKGVFPILWKEATVIPLHKGGDNKVISNYRPISLLPFISKLLEKLLHKRLYTIFLI